MSSTRRALPLLMLLLLTGAPAGADDPNPAKAEAELKAVRAQMEKMRADMERDVGKRDKLSKDLEESEMSVGSARGELDRLRCTPPNAPSSRSSAAARRPSSRKAVRLSRDRSAPRR